MDVPGIGIDSSGMSFPHLHLVKVLSHSAALLTLFFYSSCRDTDYSSVDTNPAFCLEKVNLFQASFTGSPSLLEAKHRCNPTIEAWFMYNCDTLWTMLDTKVLVSWVVFWTKWSNHCKICSCNLIFMSPQCCFWCK